MKKSFKAAYACALKVQKACLFEPVTVEVKVMYTEKNDDGDGIKAWSLYLSVWDNELSTWIEAQWVEWEPERFDNQKAEIIEYLTNNGIVIK